MRSKALVAASLKPFVLSVLANGESYGYEIIQRVSTLTDGQLQWSTGSLYPLLHNLENSGLLKGVWREAKPGPNRRYYHLTSRGYKALETEKSEWIRLNNALMTLWRPQATLSPA